MEMEEIAAIEQGDPRMATSASDIVKEGNQVDLNVAVMMESDDEIGGFVSEENGFSIDSKDGVLVKKKRGGRPGLQDRLIVLGIHCVNVDFDAAINKKPKETGAINKKPKETGAINKKQKHSGSGRGRGRPPGPNYKKRKFSSNETHQQIGAAETPQIGAGETTQIGAGETTQIGACETTQIGADETAQIGVGETTQIGVAETAQIGAAETAQIGAGETTQIGAGETSDVPIIDYGFGEENKNDADGASASNANEGGDNNMCSEPSLKRKRRRKLISGANANVVGANGVGIKVKGRGRPFGAKDKKKRIRRCRRLLDLVENNVGSGENPIYRMNWKESGYGEEDQNHGGEASNGFEGLNKSASRSKLKVMKRKWVVAGTNGTVHRGRGRPRKYVDGYKEGGQYVEGKADELNDVLTSEVLIDKRWC